MRSTARQLARDRARSQQSFGITVNGFNAGNVRDRQHIQVPTCVGHFPRTSPLGYSLPPTAEASNVYKDGTAPPFPFLFSPFPFFPFPFLTSSFPSHGIPPLNHPGNLGELLQWIWAKSQSRQMIWCTFESKRAVLVATVFFLHL